MDIGLKWVKNRSNEKQQSCLLFSFCVMPSVLHGIIDLVRTQNFQKNYYVLAPDTHT